MGSPEKMGGQILAGQEVQQILIKEKKARCGLKDGREITGRSHFNVDAHHTFSRPHRKTTFRVPSVKIKRDETHSFLFHPHWESRGWMNFRFKRGFLRISSENFNAL
jgi:phytoene dehydrogenase-like protein